jgi:hypothetical protein
MEHGQAQRKLLHNPVTSVGFGNCNHVYSSSAMRPPVSNDGLCLILSVSWFDKMKR